MSDHAERSVLFRSQREARVYLVGLMAVTTPVLLVAVFLAPGVVTEGRVSPVWLLRTTQGLFVMGLVVNVPHSVMVYRRRFPSASLITALANGPTCAGAPRVVAQALNASGLRAALATRVAWTVVVAYTVVLFAGFAVAMYLLFTHA
jgi:hypothetical protein